jgi:stage II sporulation protein D
VFQRLVARYPDFAALVAIQDIEISQRESGGRPTRFRLIGATGEFRELSAENFRLALGSRTMPSTACDITMTPTELHIENGCGSGHGLGLCQWGMEGQAREGHSPADILRFYYPGSRLTRVY